MDFSRRSCAVLRYQILIAWHLGFWGTSHVKAAHVRNVPRLPPTPNEFDARAEASHLELRYPHSGDYLSGFLGPALLPMRRDQKAGYPSLAERAVNGKPKQDL